MSSFIATILIAGVSVLGATDLDTAPIPTTPNVEVCDGHVHKHTAKEHKEWSKRLYNRYKIPKAAKAKNRHMLSCALTPRDRSVMRKQWRKVHQMKLPRNHDLWIRIGRCEQPGSGYRGVNWSHSGPTYQGGLGFWYGTWSTFKSRNMPSNAGSATWRQQMKVANKLYDRYGGSPWGCY